MILDTGSGCCRVGYMVDSGHIYNTILHLRNPNFDIHLLSHASFQALIHSIPISLILHFAFSLFQPLILNAFGEFIWTLIYEPGKQPFDHMCSSFNAIGNDWNPRSLKQRFVFGCDGAGILSGSHDFYKQDVIAAIFKFVWSKKAIDPEKIEDGEASKGEVNLLLRFQCLICVKERAGTSKTIWPTSANPNAVRLSCELLQLFATEAVQRAATIAEAEGGTNIEATHQERILPQLLLDF
ncbi:putative centromere protein X [Helianthus annuus]|nr:putative centromere protein X [Helianthus annuus]